MTRRSLTCIAGETSPISSRKSVPPCGRLEDAEAVLHRAREGATRVPEELALEERVRERTAVDGDKTGKT